MLSGMDNNYTDSLYRIINANNSMQYFYYYILMQRFRTVNIFSKDMSKTIAVDKRSKQDIDSF